MKVRFIWIDKTKKGPEKELIEKYIKRIKSFINVEIIELKSGRNRKSPKEVIRDEAKEIRKNILPTSFVIATSPKGKELDSYEFATLIEKELKNHSGNISILIGGRYGLSEELISKCNLRLSISKMTLNHYLVRIFLLEQVYRAFCIINNYPYAS